MESHSTVPVAPESPIGAGWILLLTGVAGILVYFYGYRSWNPPPLPAAGIVLTGSAPTPPVAPTNDALVDLALPDGATLRVAPDGVEPKLVAFITDSGRPVDNTTWFTLDRLDFETSSAALRESSNAQLDTIAAILRAFPNVKVKLGGYTDSTGNVQANLQLSGERANSALAALVSRAIDATRLQAEGYGEQFPVTDNSTAEGRARNRRTDVRVTEK